MFDFNQKTEKKESSIILANNVEIPISRRGNINTLVIGNKETDKFSSFIFPNIKNCLGSYIIADYDNEIFNNTSNALKENGYNIINIDLNTNSIYNPFMYIQNDLDAQIFSGMVSKRNELKSDDFFKEDTCEIIFRIIVQYSLAMLPKEKQNLEYCIKIIQKLKENNIQYLQLVMSKIDSSANVMRYYDTIGKIPINTYHSLLELLEKKLNTLGELSYFSCTNSIDLKNLSSTKTALYVNISSNTIINSIFFTQFIQKLFDCAYNNNGFLDSPTFFILDNFEKLGYIDNFSINLPTSKSKKIAFDIILDNIEELSLIYPKDIQSIFSSCDLALYLGTSNLKTIEYISTSLEGNVPVNAFLELYKTMCITYEKGLAPIKAVKYGKETPTQNELRDFEDKIQSQKEQAKVQEKETRNQQNLDAIKKLEEALKNETDPVNIKALQKTIDVLKAGL